MFSKLLLLTVVLGGWSDGYTWRVTVKHHETQKLDTFELNKGSRRVPVGDNQWCEIKLEMPDMRDWIGGASQSVFVACERAPSAALRAWAEGHVKDSKQRRTLLEAAAFKVGTGGFCAFDQRNKVIGLHVYFGPGQTYQVKAECL